jgi:hypothetical protein
MFSLFFMQSGEVAVDPFVTVSSDTFFLVAHLLSALLWARTLTREVYRVLERFKHLLIFVFVREPCA